MRSILFGILLAATVAPLSAQEGTQEDLRAQCEQFAIEDEIPPEEKALYMKECMGEVPVSGAAQVPTAEKPSSAPERSRNNP